MEEQTISSPFRNAGDTGTANNRAGHPGYVDSILRETDVLMRDNVPERLAERRAAGAKDQFTFARTVCARAGRT
jgi:hypothetical protein